MDRKVARIPLMDGEHAFYAIGRIYRHRNGVWTNLLEMSLVIAPEPSENFKANRDYIFVSEDREEAFGMLCLLSIEHGIPYRVSYFALSDEERAEVDRRVDWHG